MVNCEVCIKQSCLSLPKICSSSLSDALIGSIYRCRRMAAVDHEDHHVILSLAGDLMPLHTLFCCQSPHLIGTFFSDLEAHLCCQIAIFRAEGILIPFTSRIDMCCIMRYCCLLKNLAEVRLRTVLFLPLAGGRTTHC